MIQPYRNRIKELRRVPFFLFAFTLFIHIERLTRSPAVSVLGRPLASLPRATAIAFFTV